MSEMSAMITILANVMSGEAAVLHDDEAMMAVGHVFLNRILHPQRIFGTTAIEVTRGFHAFGPDRRPTDEVLELAHQLVANRMVLGSMSDPTQGCMYMLSFQDIERLFGDAAPCVWPMSDWQSNTHNATDGTFFRLYGFKEWPKPSNEAPLCDPREEQ